MVTILSRSLYGVDLGLFVYVLIAAELITSSSESAN